MLTLLSNIYVYISMELAGLFPRCAAMLLHKPQFTNQILALEESSATFKVLVATQRSSANELEDEVRGNLQPHR